MAFWSEVHLMPFFLVLILLDLLVYPMLQLSLLKPPLVLAPLSSFLLHAFQGSAPYSSGPVFLSESQIPGFRLLLSDYYYWPISRLALPLGLHFQPPEEALPTQITPRISPS